ncbi:MAG: hypothetical protein M1358_16090 [Chloroflexi bacterium]|nr:hypothetical protein [Chloroflexota bacterium]
MDLSSKKVTVSYDPKRANPAAIKKALEAGGDTVVPSETQ